VRLHLPSVGEILATFEDIIDSPDAVLSTETPFYFSKVEGKTRWSSPNNLRLEPDSAFKNNGGRAYLIVKPEYEVDIRIRSESWKHFNIGDAVPADIRAAYDIQLSNPFFSVTGWQSSITITLRGGAMAAITASGDRGVWDKQGSTFHAETVSRGITQADDHGALMSGILFSLTAPFQNYRDGGSYTIWLPTEDNDLSVDILGYRNIGIQDATVPTIGDVLSDETEDEYVFADWSREYLVGSGVDCQDQAWEVRVVERQEDGTWFVITDGTIEASTTDYDEVLALARDRVASRELEAENCQQEEEPKGGGKTLALVGIAFVGVLVLIILAKR
tara:strand:+ start:1046 stop:2041 length:996 start_codon:yes stop_codon:yes gene_type:complete